MLPTGWFDVTEDLKDNESPFTLAREDGVGALQFSPAIYRFGKLPQITTEHLSDMLQTFAETKQLGEAYGKIISEGDIKVAAANFSFGEEFLRVWYCSDGKNIALITYTCAGADSSREVKECEEIVASIRFEK